MSDVVILTAEGRKNLKDNGLLYGDSSRSLGMMRMCHCLCFFTRRLLCFSVMLLIVSALFAQKGEGKHWGAEVEFMPGKALVMDEYQRKWMRGRDNYTIGLDRYTVRDCSRRGELPYGPVQVVRCLFAAG